MMSTVHNSQPDFDTAERIRTLDMLLPTLDKEMRIAIRLRFWGSMTIQEVATVLELSWDATDRLIENSIQRLREGFRQVEQRKELLATG